MKTNIFKVSNTKKYIFFALITLVIVGLFVFFFIKFNKLDDNNYSLTAGSIMYNDDYNYLSVDKSSYLSQKIDGYYYLFQKEGNKTKREKISKNPVVFNKNDYKIYLYGSAYEIKSNGDVITLDNKTEISKTSPTKFYKLRDRKYLMVDSSLRTNDGSIKTTGYLIIELDKQGNATFANNEMNIKTIKPLILKGTTMNFDIANEKLIYGKKEINLKNIIGSTNAYTGESIKNKEEKETDDKKNSSGSGGSGGGGGGGNNSYYDEYITNVINSVNNLTTSVTEVNDKSDMSVKKGEIYYDFSKYVALKSVDSSITTLTINYAVVDANNEYQSVFVELDDNLDNVSRYYLNKNEIVYTIRDLMVDHNYTLSFGYKLVGSDEEVVEDVVNVKTKAPTCSMRVTKLSSTSLTYNIKISSEYKLDSGNVVLSVLGGEVLGTSGINMDAAISDKGYTGNIQFRGLGDINVLSLDNVVYNGARVGLNCSYRFRK